VLAAIAATLLTACPARCQDKLATLGAQLFSDTALSSSGTVSCATCHDPKKSFADGKADAEGEMKIATGRNTPTLVGIKSLTRFRDPDQARTAKPGRTPRVLSLEDRCLEPLQNDLEMGRSADVAVAALKNNPAKVKAFDAGFGDQNGVTKPRLATALAEFVRSLEPARALTAAPYARHLAGDANALAPAQERGLAVFKSRGCADCHSGSALSDGMMHVVDPPWGQRMLDRQRAASERRIELLRRDYAKHKTVEDVQRMTADLLAREAKTRAHTLPGGGGYDPEQLEVQTTTLWDVARTGPWFRDGSMKSLESTVKTHVREMRTVRDNEPRIRAELARLETAGKRSPVALRAAPTSANIPDEGLPPQELADLIQFLNALSPG
jgi:cytochrome c peroxidase